MYKGYARDFTISDDEMPEAYCLREVHVYKYTEYLHRSAKGKKESGTRTGEARIR